MKKLMFAVAAVAAGTVLADVTSQNIVGYANNTNTTLSGGSIVASMFQVVGNADGKIKFGDLVPLMDATGAKAAMGMVNAQFLKITGETDITYMWMGTYWMNTSTFGDASEELIPAGKALWLINNSGAAISLQSTGEVNTKDILTPMSSAGGATLGNAFPVDTTFANIIPKNHASGAVAGMGTVNLQYLKITGETDITYMWMGTYWMNTSTFGDASKEVVPAGKGFWVINNAGVDLDLYIAAPEL